MSASEFFGSYVPDEEHAGMKALADLDQDTEQSLLNFLEARRGLLARRMGIHLHPPRLGSLLFRGNGTVAKRLKQHSLRNAGSGATKIRGFFFETASRMKEEDHYVAYVWGISAGKYNDANQLVEDGTWLLVKISYTSHGKEGVARVHTVEAIPSDPLTISKTCHLPLAAIAQELTGIVQQAVKDATWHLERALALLTVTTAEDMRLAVSQRAWETKVHQAIRECTNGNYTHLSLLEKALNHLWWKMPMGLYSHEVKSWRAKAGQEID